VSDIIEHLHKSCECVAGPEILRKRGGVMNVES